MVGLKAVEQINGFSLLVTGSYLEKRGGAAIDTSAKLDNRVPKTPKADCSHQMMKSLLRSLLIRAHELYMKLTFPVSLL